MNVKGIWANQNNSGPTHIDRGWREIREWIERKGIIDTKEEQNSRTRVNTCTCSDQHPFATTLDKFIKH